MCVHYLIETGRQDLDGFGILYMQVDNHLFIRKMVIQGAIFHFSAYFRECRTQGPISVHYSTVEG